MVKVCSIQEQLTNASKEMETLRKKSKGNSERTNQNAVTDQKNAFGGPINIFGCG